MTENKNISVKVMNMTKDQKMNYCIAHINGEGCIFGKKEDNTLSGMPCMHCVRDIDQSMLADYIRKTKIFIDEFTNKSK